MNQENKTELTLTAIIREAGLYHRQVLEFNDIDSQVIQLGDYIIADINNDDLVDKNDILVTVDNRSVEVIELDANNNLITVNPAPKSGQIVRVHFASSSVELDYVEQVRAEILSEISAKIPCSAVWKSEHRSALAYIHRLMAAGALLIRDYGLNEDIEGTSKDGYKRLKLANDKLNELIASVCGTERATTGCGFAVCDDGDLFPQKTRNSSEEW